MPGRDASMRSAVHRFTNTLPGTLVVGKVVALAPLIGGAVAVSAAGRERRSRTTGTRINRMSSMNDVTTLGRARLSFANESEIDEFAEHAG